MANVKVAFKNVFDKRAVYKVVEAKSLIKAVEEYARLYYQDDDERYHTILREKVQLRLNGKVVQVDDWSSTPLRDGDKILITPRVEGDSAGIIGIVIGAVLIAASIVFAPYLTPMLASFTIGSMTAVTSIFLMGAAMILSGLMSLLMQPDLPTMSSGGLGGKGSNTYSWQGITTQANPSTPVPIVYGKHMVGGQLINIFTERQGESDYLYMLIALCEGEIQGICTEENTDNICTTTDQGDAAYKHPYITLDDQPFKNFVDVEWWYRKGTNLPAMANGQYDPTVQNIIPHFTGSRMQIDDGRNVNVEGIVYTTTKDVDIARVQIRFPSLFHASGGDVGQHTVNFAIDYRKNGDSDWVQYSDPKRTPTVTPQANAYNSYVTTPARDFSVRWVETVPGVVDGGAYALTQHIPDSIWMQCTGSSEQFIRDGYQDEWTGAYSGTLRTTKTLLFKNTRTNEVWTESLEYSQHANEQFFHYEWQASESTISAMGYQEVINPTRTVGEFHLQMPTSIQTGDTYLFTSTNSTQYWHTVTTKSKTGFWKTVELNFHELASGEGKQTYDIRVKRQSAKSEDFNTADNIVLMSVVEIVNGDFIYPNTALLGMRIRASDQLSGQPPNVNVLLQGKKIQVPNHSGSETFQEIFWSEDNERWEYDGAARTWDEATYTSEYSNNAMLCLKDLMTNKIYGLGEYTNNNDFSTTNEVALIKECHKEYTPTEKDYLSWWDAGNNAEFVKNIEDGLVSTWDNTLTISASAQTITYAGAWYHSIPVRLDSPLKGGQRYRFSITLSGTDANVDIDLATKRGDWTSPYNVKFYQIGNYTAPEISNKGDGTHTYDFTAPYTGIIGLVIYIKKNGSAKNITGIITDISLSSIQGTGSSYAWHYHTFNGVFDTAQAALTTLLEFCQAFRVWPSWYEGTFQFIMDKDETPIHTIAINNTRSFSQSWTPLSEIPYRVQGQFTDEDEKYVLTQITVQSTDTNVPKSNKQTVGLKGITNRKRAEREIKHKLTKFINCTHMISIKCGLDMIHATAGDVINVSNDVPSWGHGARVASYDSVNKYLYLTEKYTISDATPTSLVVKYQDQNNSFQTATINVTGITDGDTVRRITLEAWPSVDPIINGVAVMGLSTTYVKKFRLLSVTRSAEDEVEANAVEHVDTIYSSEPTLVVNQYFERRELDAKVGPPGPPKNAQIKQLMPTEGMGWDIYAEHADMKSQEIIVEMAEGLNANYYNPIGVINRGQSELRYLNSELKFDSYYSFRFYAKNAIGRSTSIYETVRLKRLTFDVEPPTGLYIKGGAPLSQQWDGLDVTISWNPIGQNWYKSGMIDYYNVYVYHTTYDPENPRTNLLRTAYVKTTEYKYTYDMNVEDNNGAALIKGTLIFVISANLVIGTEGRKSRPFRVTNANPNTPQNFTSNVSLRTVTFKWSPVSDTDFKTFRYRYRYKDNSGTPMSAWSSWSDTTSNEVPVTVNGTNIGIYGNLTRVFLESKTVDIYNGSSNIASGNNVTESLGVTIGTQTIASWMLADDAIVNVKILASAINSRTIATGAITSDAIVANAIVADKLAASSVTTNKIQTNGIVAAKVAANAIIADKIAANAVSAAKINVATLSAIAANMGVLTAGIAKSADGRVLIDFDSKFIKIFDAASTLRVQIGSIS